MLRKVIVAGVASGVGKTSVAVALMYALRKRGFNVQPFKVGPDFIDPSYHTFASKNRSRNLDVWMMGEQGVVESFVNASRGADMAVIEGVMGLFDGMTGKDNFASTAHVAKILDTPVLLVVDASKGARSIAAIIFGFLRFDESIRIAGIILNNVASARHASYIIDALKGKIKAPVVGVIHRNAKIKVEERHLGLVPTSELRYSRMKNVLVSARYISDQLDLDKIIDLCGTVCLPRVLSPQKTNRAKTRIAVALDESFNFYYADGLQALKKSGAELVFFSPVNDLKLPDDTDGIILGGGFPEVLADKLEKNHTMIKSIRKAVHDGIPIYGECGGLMYLTRSIQGYKGEKKARKMVGVLDAITLMTNRLTLNYTEATCNGPIFGRTSLRGHEFHYSSIENLGRDSKFAYSMKKGKGITGKKDGLILNECGLASYMHLHFANAKLSDNLVRTCEAYSHR